MVLLTLDTVAVAAEASYQTCWGGRPCDGLEEAAAVAGGLRESYGAAAFVAA